MNSSFQNCGLLPPTSKVLSDHVLRDVGELVDRELVVVGPSGVVGVASLGTSTASTAAFTFAASVGSTRFAFFWMPWTAAI